MAKTQIQDYIFHPGLGANDNLYPNAYSLVESNKLFIQKEATAWIQSQIDAAEPDFIGYTYNSAKCERDIGYNIDAYLADLRYGGNENTYNVVKYYWDQDVAQIDGNRAVEVATYGFIKDLIQIYILPNASYTPINLEVTQTIDVSKTAESGTSSILGTLIDATADVIETGLSEFPTFEESGQGFIKMQGKHDIANILLITNATDSKIIFNFSSIDTGGNVELISTTDSDFVTFKQTVDYVSKLYLNYDTSSMSSTDELIIFTEYTENGQSVTTTRPYNFGTDAIERNRVAPPLSMLDADFEYGLQPTKWAAIGTLRGYPSIYEVPGTDTPVLSVTTNASSVNTYIFTATNNGTSDWVLTGEDRNGTITAVNDPAIYIVEGDTLQFVNNASNSHPFYIKTAAGTGTGNQVEGVIDQGGSGGTVIEWTPPTGSAGTYYYQCSSHAGMVGEIIVQTNTEGAGSGQSLITVTTVGAHGFETGTPITIKALEDSVTGASRAEGSFVIYSVPDTNQLTYFAKAQVGDTNGEVLSTTYTQLRQAGFYTGADIGNPIFTVVTNGSGGNIFTELTTPSGSTNIPYDGPAPAVAAPVSGTGIDPGTQVTGTIDQSEGGGVYLTPVVVGDYTTGASTITVFDATGIIDDLATDNGSGTATYVESVAGNDISFTTAFTSAIIGNRTTYNNVSGDNIVGTGTNAEFTISKADGIYTIDSIDAAGSDYIIGDRFLISGTDLSGITPDNDLLITVQTVDADGGIATVTSSGEAFDGAYVTESISPDVEGGDGVDALFDVAYSSNTFSTVTLNTSVSTSSGYIEGDRLKISGAILSPVGVDGTNDLIIDVLTVDAGTGEILTFNFSGTAPNAENTYVAATYTSTTVAGTGAVFDVTKTGTVYSAVETSGATADYVIGETFTVSGSDVGGSPTTNDVTITIDNVDGSGAITAFSVSGVASNSDSLTLQGGTNLVGTGAEFEIEQFADSTSYDVLLLNGGSDYAANQEFIILGSTFFGDDVTNDLTITIDSVDAAGAITAISVSGTSTDGSSVHSGLTPPLDSVEGAGATFNVLRADSGYTTTVASGGSGYKAGNSLTISAADLGGVDPDHNLTIRIDSVSGGAISTFTQVYTSAYEGDIFDLISTVQISEPTTAEIPAATNLPYTALATLEAEFDNAHGLVPGDTFIVTISSDSGTNQHEIASGSFFASDVPTSNTLRWQARSAGFIDDDGDITGAIYPRPDSFFIHRPYDGGVQLGTGGPQHGAQAIRQSKKYIRYQSGKGIMYTTGALFAPSYDLRSVTASDVEVGALITIETDDNDHGVQEGGIIRLLGIETPGYNSGDETAVPPRFDYEVVNVIDERTFQVRAQRRLGATSAVLGFAAQMTVVSWHGATVRSGIFDDQNGIFWEYDGTNLSVVQRTGTKQVAGTIAMDIDDNLITGTNTRFRDQLTAGDRVIIKGMTHVVSHVISQTEMTVTPDWRGVVDISGTKMLLISDKKVKQEDFNLDRLDGTGPSGYNLDTGKMQMIGIQYSWYGAGFIDFMLRGSDGNFVFCHRMRNSNVNTEAFMRSGNLPVRYEVTNEGPPGKLAAAMTDSQDTISLVDSSFFPDSGVVYIDNEIISFTGNNKTTNTLTGCTRADTFRNFQAGAQRQYTAGAAATHDDRTGVILISCTITPLISHWGSAFLTDGGFDEDRGYIFSYAETGLEVSTTPATAFMIRLSPSVSNALVGDLGERELLNRAQLLLQSLEVTSDTGTGGIVVEGVLNPQNYPTNPSFVDWSTLSSQAQGGQPSFAQIASSGAITWSTDSASTVVNPQSAAFPSASVTLDPYPYDNLSLDSGWDRIYILSTTWNANYTDIRENDKISGTGIASGTEVDKIRTNQWIDGQRYTVITMSNDATQNVSGQTTVTFTREYRTSSTSVMYFDKTSWDTSGVVAGTTTTDPNFAANTQVSGVSLDSYLGTQYYEVKFSNSYNATINPGVTTVEFTFIEPVYALPGETIFSFIANPGERATVDFSELKELTNTPLGGRGTYPNGPDVLAINLYKVSGAAIDANVILKWGEAQA